MNYCKNLSFSNKMFYRGLHVDYFAMCSLPIAPTSLLEVFQIKQS